MAINWTYHPPRENYNRRWLAEHAGHAAEVVETSSGGPWMVTIRQGKEIVGVHRTAADAEGGKKLAEELLGGVAVGKQ